MLSSFFALHAVSFSSVKRSLKRIHPCPWWYESILDYFSFYPSVSSHVVGHFFQSLSIFISFSIQLTTYSCPLTIVPLVLLGESWPAGSLASVHDR